MNLLRAILLRIFSSKFREVHYINGAESLPVPLSTEEENRIIERIECDEEARRMLIEHNLRLVVYIAKKFENTRVPIEDLISIGTIGLIKAINTFKADRNIKLATYASRCIENEILMFIRKAGPARSEVSFDEPLNVDRDGNELLLSDILGSDEDSVFSDLEKTIESETVRSAVYSLCERERKIIELRYGMADGYEHTQKEVADMLGISQSYISRLEKKIILRLKEEIGEKV